MQTTIIATKMMNGRLVERKFNQLAWDMAGKDKNGWAAKDEQKVVAAIPLPPKGETKPQVVTPVPKLEVKQVTEIDQVIKNEFMTIAGKVGKGMIKDFFDKQNPAVPYSNSANIIEIRNLLASYLNYDIKKLNEAFR